MAEELIKSLIQQYNSVLKAKRLKQNLSRFIIAEKERLKELEATVDKEYYDIVELESKPIAQLFSLILKSEIKQLEKERQEYLVAVLEFQECEKSIELLEYEYSVLENVVFDEDKLKTELDKKLKEVKVKSLDSQIYIKQLIGVVKRIFTISNLQTEVKEALDLATEIHDTFGLMIKSLQKAKNHIDWGDFYSEVQRNKEIKKSFLDDAQESAYLIKKLVILLQPDLQDLVDISNNFKEDKSYLFQFNITYYHNLINDWVNDSNLATTLTSTTKASAVISKLKRELKDLHLQLQKKNSTLEEKRVLLIETISEE